MPEVAPIALHLLAWQGAQSQVGLGRRAWAQPGDEVAEVRASAHVAALAHHGVQPRRGERGELGQGGQDEGPVRVDSAVAQRRRVRRRAVAREHAPHDIAVYAQLPGNGAHPPLLDVAQAQDLRDQVRGYGHDAAP